MKTIKSVTEKPSSLTGKGLNWKFPVVIACLLLIWLPVFMSGKPDDFGKPASNVAHAAESVSPSGNGDKRIYPVDMDSFMSRLTEHFSIRGNLRTSAEALAVLMDPIVYDRINELNLNLEIAIDSNADLSALTDFGLLPLDDGSYRLVYPQYPAWNPLHSYLQFLLVPAESFDSAADLRRLGMSSENLDRLRDYIAARDIETELTRVNLNLLDGALVDVSPQMTREDTLQAIFELQEDIGRATANVWKNWSLGLMQQLDNQGREFLFEYLRDKVVPATIYPTPLEVVIDGFVNEINTSAARNAMRRSLQ